jgi:hexokinase
MNPREFDHESSKSRLTDAINLLYTHGEIPFSTSELRAYFVLARIELERKRFIPTYLTAYEPGNMSLPKNTLELGFEIGGTKNRATIGITDETTRFSQLAGIEKAFDTKIFTDPDNFFATVATIGKPIIKQAKTLGDIHAFHVIFSFPGETHKTSYGIDVKPFQEMSKGFIVPGIEQVDVGEMMWKQYKKQGLQIPEGAIMIVPNDTAAGLMNAHISGVDGTGVNFAIAIADHRGTHWIYNTEAGELTFLPLSGYEKQVHDKGRVIARHIETIAGGDSMGKTFDTIIHDMVREGIIPYRIIGSEPFSSKHLSDVLANNRDQFHVLFENFDAYDTETWEVLTLIAKYKTARAVQAIGSTCAALIYNHPESFPKKEIIFPMEGSNFWKTPKFPEMVKSQIEYFIPEHTITFVQTSGSLGATYAALRYYNQTQGQT